MDEDSEDDIPIRLSKYEAAFIMANMKNYWKWWVIGAILSMIVLGYQCLSPDDEHDMDEDFQDDIPIGEYEDVLWIGGLSVPFAW